MKLVRIFQRRPARALDRVRWRRLSRGLLEECLAHRDYELGLHFIGATEMARLNETFLGHEGSTDVITFNHQAQGGVGETEQRMSAPLCGLRRHCEPKLTQHLYGEIFICVDDAIANARRFHVRWQWEVARCLIHGVLHLEGFEDADPASRRAMKRRENKLLKELSARFDLGRLGRRCR
jgi:probable rRNA maturation factor